MGPGIADPLADMEDLRPIDLTGSNASIDLNGSTASLDLAASGNRESRPAEPASLMPPLAASTGSRPTRRQAEATSSTRATREPAWVRYSSTSAGLTFISTQLATAPIRSMA